MTAAVTRSGRPCPFTMDRLPDLIPPGSLERFFRIMPDGVLCAEVAGPGNPYMDIPSPRGGDDVRLFVFDLLRLGEPDFLPLAERDGILDEAGLPQAPRLGVYDLSRLEALKERIRALDTEGAEGVVLKPPGRGCG
ncbi:MAG: hypothetical protein U5L11_02070 [Arhodomonas sp.]|nr:hypothetical protein [Arhodomonas sp.]